MIIKKMKVFLVNNPNCILDLSKVKDKPFLKFTPVIFDNKVVGFLNPSQNQPETIGEYLYCDVVFWDRFYSEDIIAKFDFFNYKINGELDENNVFVIDCLLEVEVKIREV